MRLFLDRQRAIPTFRMETPLSSFICGLGRKDRPDVRLIAYIFLPVPNLC